MMKITYRDLEYDNDFLKKRAKELLKFVEERCDGK